MKSPLFVGVAAVLVLAGCGQKSETPTGGTNSAAAGGNPVNAPADYLGALAKGQQQAVKTIDTASVDRAIQMFAAEHGRNPKDLNELVQEKYIPKIPDAPHGMKLVYDPAGGTVKVETQ